MTTKQINYKQTEIGEIPEDWDVSSLYDLATWINGRVFMNDEFSINGKPVVKISELKNGISDQTQFSENIFEDKYLLRKGDLLFSWSGQPETSIDVFWYMLPEGWLNQHIFKVLPKEVVSTEFLYYLLKFNKDKFVQICRDKQTTGLGHVTVQDLKRLMVVAPNKDEQARIVSFLSSLDEKIELNKRINKTLEEIGKALFNRWFVDFEFTNEDGKPYKSTGGKMVDSELGGIPRGWRIGALGDAIKILDSKRIPLSSREREKRKGIYRYYGATEVMDFVDDCIFDGIYLLVGEDGSVTKDDGSPFTQYVWGKFWVNNHAHVLQGASGFSTEFLHIFLNLTNITPFVTGAVQLKLNQENMKSIPMIIPQDYLLKKFNTMLDGLYDQIRLNFEQIKALAQIRDSLLPRLMSGKLRVTV